MYCKVTTFLIGVMTGFVGGWLMGVVMLSDQLQLLFIATVEAFVH
jgi:hypothetical protein